MLQNKTAYEKENFAVYAEIKNKLFSEMFRADCYATINSCYQESFHLKISYKYLSISKSMIITKPKFASKTVICTYSISKFQEVFFF